MRCTPGAYMIVVAFAGAGLSLMFITPTPEAWWLPPCTGFLLGYAMCASIDGVR